MPNITRIGDRAPVSIDFGEDARVKLLRGAAELARAVGCTLGPWGKTVLIENQFGKLMATRDGVTVARFVKLDDPVEQMGCTLLRDAAMKVVAECGDGTTTTIVLAEALMREVARQLASGVDPSILAAELRQAHRRANGVLMGMTKAMQWDDVTTVVKTACKDDPRVTGPVLKALAHTLDAGTVVIRDSDVGDTVVTLEDGLRLDRGWLTESFRTGPGPVVLDDCIVFVSVRQIDQAQTLLPVLEAADNTNRSLLVIAKAVTGSALETCIGNARDGHLRVCVVPAPFFGQHQRDALEDVAAWASARVDDMPGQPIDTTCLGLVDRAMVSKDRTMLVGSPLGRSRADARLAYVRSQMERMTNEYDLDHAGRSVGRLHGKVAEIAVGAPTNSDTALVKAQVEDAVGAVKAAWRDGLLPGGGTALALASLALGDPDPSLGLRALRVAMEAPCRRIAANGGRDPGIAVSDAVRGYGPAEAKDPTSVVCAALRAAVSTVATMLMSETTMVYSRTGHRKGGWVKS